MDGSAPEHPEDYECDGRDFLIVSPLLERLTLIRQVNDSRAQSSA